MIPKDTVLTTMPSHAADLTEREWSSIIRTNCLLSGHRILTSSYRLDGKKDKVILDGVERSPYNGRKPLPTCFQSTNCIKAFKLKPRIFEAYEISSSDPEDDESHFNGEQYYFRVPRFRVDDDSCVTVFEVKTGFEKSLANSSFSETSFQVAGGGGAWGWSAGLKLGGSTGSSSDSSSIGAQAEESLVVTYNVSY